MKIILIIFFIYLVRYAHLKPVSEPFDFPKLPKIIAQFIKTPCDHITSISTIAYNRQHPYGVENIKEQDTCGYIGSNKKVVFTIHGFISSPNTSYIYDLASQLIKNDNTVFSVNWTEGSCESIDPYLLWVAYDRATENTYKTGELVGNYIAHITNKCQVPLKNIILIGHSLGAHVSGFAAKYVKSQNINYNGIITDIIGADPAGPHFEDNDCDKRLCNTDAEHVTVLHTTELWGINKPIGHLNLYFNDASYQPGCGIDFFRTCSHNMAVKYLTVLLKNSNCGFPGVPQLKWFDKSKRPTSTSTNCIFVDRKIFEQNNITPKAYTVFVNDKLPFCSQNTFPNCQQ